MNLDAKTLDYEKAGGLVAAIVQHAHTGEVLMLGWMNAGAVEASQATGHVTFFSRSRQRLWTKGETSGNTLSLVSMTPDCDRDALLVRALPAGPACHLGTRSCFGETPGPEAAFLARLEAIVESRKGAAPETSYTARLFSKGIKKIAQKVGEEGVECAIAGVSEDDAALTGEAADLLYHLLVLLRARGLGLSDVAAELARRHAPQTPPDDAGAPPPDGTDDGA